MPTATSRSVQQVNVAERTAQADGTVVKKGRALAKNGRKVVQSSASQVRTSMKATGKKATSGQTRARAKARKAGAAIGKILGRAQGLSRKLVTTARRRLT